VNTTTATGSGAEQNNLNFSFSGASQQLVSVKNASSQTIVNQQSNFDILYRQNQSKVLSAGNIQVSVASVKYDNWGNVVFSEDPFGHVTYYSYSNTNTSNSFPGSSGFTNSFYTNTIPSNIHNLLLGQADYQNGSGSAKQETYYEYNSVGEMIQSKQLHNVNGTNTWLLTSYTYDHYGNQITMKDSLNRTTYYQFSGTYQHAYMTQSSILVSGKNISTLTGYNFTLGLKAWVRNPNGQNTSYTYDKIGRQTAIIYPLISGVAATEVFSYYDSRNYYTVTDPDGNNVTYHYDGLGRSNLTAYYNGTQIYTTINYSYSWLNQPNSVTTSSGVTKHAYDSLARQFNVTNPDGTKVITTYNIPYKNYTVANENGHPTQYIDDIDGRLVSERQYYNSSSYYQTNYTYDQSGNLVSIKDAKGAITTYKYDDLNRLILTTYPDGKNQSLTYDNVGNILTVKSQNGSTVSYSYDALNRLVNVSYPGGSTVNYIYDNDSNKISTSYGITTVLSKYDARDRLVNQTTVINGTAYTLLYSYDKLGNIVSMTYPDGSTVAFSYDFLNRVTKVGSTANLTYTSSNEVNSISFANGATTSYSYDSRLRTTRILSTHGVTTLLDLNYTYDSASNVKSINTQNFTYDWINRLTSAVGGWGTINYTYDGVGNILTMKQGGVTKNYTYSTYNRLSSVGSTNFTYDANGNNIKETNGSTTWNYTFDYENRLVSVTKNGTNVQKNTYSADGKRVAMTVGGSTLINIYDGSNLIYQKNLTSSQVTDFYYGDGMVLGNKVASSSYYYVLDELRSARLLLNSSAASAYSSDYKPFGLPYLNSGSSLLMYTGQIFDPSTGLYYYNARFYNPAIQRFISQDSMMSLENTNQYSYSNDNPVTMNDPTGHIAGYSITQFANYSHGSTLLKGWMLIIQDYAFQGLGGAATLGGLLGGKLAGRLGGSGAAAATGYLFAAIGLLIYTASWYPASNNALYVYVDVVAYRTFLGPFVSYVEIGFWTNKVIIPGVEDLNLPGFYYFPMLDSAGTHPLPHFSPWPTGY
jgi:RHS repeat-associated protein